MRATGKITPLTTPALLDSAIKLGTDLKRHSAAQIANDMQLSPKKAQQTHDLLAAWQAKPNPGVAAIEAFVGDIYSGLQLPTWTQQDIKQAQKQLRIMSGLYGILRPLDAITPYRLEMGYKFTPKLLGKYQTMYQFWGSKIADVLPKDKLVIDLTAKEYSKVIAPALKTRTVVTPKFLTIDSQTNRPKQVIVHTKIARGAFARWLIQEQPTDLAGFDQLGYRYDIKLSASNQPVFIAKQFGGIGLSIRLT